MPIGTAAPSVQPAKSGSVTLHCRMPNRAKRNGSESSLNRVAVFRSLQRSAAMGTSPSQTVKAPRVRTRITGQECSSPCPPGLPCPAVVLPRRTCCRDRARVGGGGESAGNVCLPRVKWWGAGAHGRSDDAASVEHERGARKGFAVAQKGGTFPLIFCSPCADAPRMRLIAA